MHKHISQKDIAIELGISKATVSRVISGVALKRGTNPDTVRMVNDAVKRLGYIPNLAGRALITRKYQTIGLLFYSTNEPLYSELIPELQARIYKRGYAALCGFWHSNDEAAMTIESLISHGVDGVITCHEPGSIPEYIPAVYFMGDSKDHDTVSANRKLTFMRAVDYLHKFGHKRIGYIFNEGLWNHLLLKNVVFRDVSLCGIPVNYTAFLGDVTAFNMEKALSKVLAMPSAQRPTAFICGNDLIGLCAGAILHAHDCSIPGDFSMVSFDATRISRFCTPALTSFGTPVDRIADELIDVLFKRLSMKALPPIHRDIEVILHERSSVMHLSE